MPAFETFLQCRRTFGNVLDFWRFQLIGPAWLLEQSGHFDEAEPLSEMWRELEPTKEYDLA